MKPTNYILSDEEKKILENHFLHNKTNSKQDFQFFCKKVIDSFSESQFNFNKQEKEKDYSINLIWDKEKNETAMMYFFNHNKFTFSNSKFKSFLIFNGDVNALNNENQNALMLLTKTNSFSTIKSLLKTKEFNLDQVDINNNSLHIYLIETYNKEMFKEYNEHRVFKVIEKIESFQNIVLDWLGTNIEKSNNQKILVKEKINIVLDGFSEYLKTLKSLENFKYLDQKELNIVEIKQANGLEKIKQMLELQENLEIKEEKRKKNKI